MILLLGLIGVKQGEQRNIAGVIHATLPNS